MSFQRSFETKFITDICILLQPLVLILVTLIYLHQFVLQISCFATIENNLLSFSSLFIRLWPNVSYEIECICFKEISVIFLNLSILFILVNILLILSKYRSTFSPYRIQTNFVADCLMRRFSCFSYYRFSYKIFWF